MTDYSSVSLSSGKLHLFDGSTTYKTILQSGDISGNITITLPTTNSATLADLDTQQTFTTKTLISPIITGSGDIEGVFTGDLTGNADTSTKIESITNSNIVQLTETQTLTNKTLTSPTITAENITTSGTDDKALDLSITLNDTTAAGGSDTFRLVKGAITETDVTGWNNVYLLDLLAGSGGDSSKFKVTSAGAVTAASTITAATGSTIGNLTLANGTITDSSGSISFDNENLTTTGTLTSGVLTVEDVINVGGGSNVGIVKFFDSDGSHSINLVAPSVVASNVSFTLPSADGNANQVLKTDGSGVLSFVDGSSTLNGLTDVVKNSTNFTGSLLIQPGSGSSAPSMTGSLANAINNIGIGDEVFEVLSSGTDNTCLGHDAGKLITEGSNNTCVGSDTVIAAAVNNQTAIGKGATCNAANQTVLGNGATGNSANEITLGNSSVTALRCGATTIASLSDQRDKTDIVDSSYGLDFVSTLRPVQFTWDRRNLVAGDETSIMNGKSRVGFIAQELQAAMPNNENDILDLVYDVNPERIEAKYGNLIPILTKAIQDLSTANDALVARVAALESA